MWTRSSMPRPRTRPRCVTGRRPARTVIRRVSVRVMHDGNARRTALDPAPGLQGAEPRAGARDGSGEVAPTGARARGTDPARERGCLSLRLLPLVLERCG